MSIKINIIKYYGQKTDELYIFYTLFRYDTFILVMLKREWFPKDPLQVRRAQPAASVPAQDGTPSAQALLSTGSKIPTQQLHSVR